MASRSRKFSVRLARLTAGVLILSLFAAACGDDDDVSGTTTSGAETTAEASDLLGEAERISNLAIEELVWAPTDSDVAPGDIVEQTGWLGPKETPAPPAEANVQIVICAPGTACEVAGEFAKQAAESLGWTAEIVPGEGTPESFATAFDSALAKNPDVIIGVAIPDVLVGAQLAKARDQGVVTVSIADAPNASGSDAYDAYVSYRMPLMHQVLAYHAIAESGGEANVILINDSAFPNLVESVEQFKRVIDGCDGCASEIVDWQITDALDPVKADAVITSALQSNSDADYIVLPYSIGISSVIEAVRKAGRADQVKVMAKDGDQIGLQAVASGGSSANAGVSLEWVAYAGIDQAIRGLAGAEYLAPEELGLGVHLFTAANVPADGVADYTQYVDYLSEYKKLWGLS